MSKLRFTGTLKEIEYSSPIGFGKENMRAYAQGIPAVFGNGTVEDVCKLFYPCSQSGWDLPAFTSKGVIRK